MSIICTESSNQSCNVCIYMYACIMKSTIGANRFSVEIEKFALEKSSYHQCKFLLTGLPGLQMMMHLVLEVFCFCIASSVGRYLLLDAHK